MSNEIKQKVYDTVVSSNQRLTPIEVEKKAAAELGVQRRVIKAAIKELVHEGVLRYTYFGNSFLESSMDRPVRVSGRIVVKPPHKVYISEKDDIVIDINSELAFGDGGHPSTYLVLRTLDSILSSPDYHKGRSLSKALDVGTGTGILAIATAKFGIKEVVGIDIDRTAVFEAEGNVRINNLIGQITISGTPLEEIRSSFSLVMANIGSQTLEMLRPLLVERIEEGGVLVLSGFTTDVCDALLKTYLQSGLKLIHRNEERNWACLILSKPRASL